MNRRIKFRHLEAFTTIARAGSLKRAAAALNLTQPAISKTLKDLEDSIGAPLLVRDRSGARMTPQGEVFLQYAEQSIAALEHGLITIETLGAGAPIELRVGALPSVAASLLPETVQRFRVLAPDVVLQIDEGPHSMLVDRLRAGALDLVVGRLGAPDTMNRLSFTQLYAEHVVFVVAPDHPLAGSDRLDAVADHLVMYPPKQAAIRPLVARMLIGQGISLFANRIESTSAAFCRAMVLGPNRAVWVISRGVVARDIADGVLVPLALNSDATSGPVGIMARAEEDPTPAARLFRTVLSEASPKKV